MADNVQLNLATTVGAVIRTFEDGSSVQWPSSVVCYATTIGTPDVLVPVTPSAGLPVAQQGTWTVAATQSGTWTVQPGNTANTTPWLFSISAGGNTATVTASSALKVDGSAVTQPISGTVTANAGTGTFTVSGAVTQSGTWTVRNEDGAGNALTSIATGSQRPLTVAVVDASGNQITSFGGAGGTASNYGSAFPATGTASGYSDGTNMQGARVFDLDTGGGTQYVLGVGLRLSGSGGSVEGGTASNPIRTDPTGTTTQPVSGTVTANAGSGTFAVSAASLPLPSGASTAAKQPALGTAGTASADVITVQGIASMTALTVAQTTASNLNCTATLAAGTALAGKVVSETEIGSLYQGTTSLTPAYATFSTSSSGNTQVVAAQGAGNKIRVLRYRVSANGSTNVKWQSATTDISGLHYLTQYASGGGSYTPAGICQGAANEALNINNSAAIAISGEVTYVVVT